MSTCTWTGQGFSFDWNETKNWDSGAPPTEDDDMVVPGGTPYDSPLPPAGTKVKNLTIRGGGLQSRMTVTESFTWQAGSLYSGVQLDGARLDISGPLDKSTGGDLDIATAGTIAAATVDLFGGARLINHGALTTVGTAGLTWLASANPFLVNHGTFQVTVGSFTLDDVIGLVRGLLTVAPGSTFVVSSRTVPTYLLAGARVAGGGVVSVRNGRLYADTTALVTAGTTLELGPGGQIESARTRTFYQSIVGPIAGRQRVAVAGQLHWTGGAVNGDVTITDTGVLLVDGPDQHDHTAGVLRLIGSGAVVGPTDLRVDTGGWRIQGDLLLQGPLLIDRGRGWELTNAGTLRIDATAGDVALGNFPLTNAGTLQVNAGRLRLSQQSGLVTQKPGGRLDVAAGASIQATDQLSLAGTVTGSGRIEGDLEALGTLRPGQAAATGTLTVDGSLQLTPGATTRVRVDDATTHSQVSVSGQVFAAGTLHLDAPGFASAPGDQLDVLLGGAGTLVAGRYTQARLPATVAGRYLHLSYNGPRVRLQTRTSIPGFDLRDPPTAAVLAAWVGASPYRWVGYYLDSPCHGPSWNGRRAALTALGLGIAVIYVGQQTTGASICGNNDTTSDRGRADADDAIAQATGQGFGAGTWIYLDLEVHPVDRVSPQMLAYVRAWVERMLEVGTYDPGIYVHRRDFAAVDAAVTSAFQTVGRPDRARYWVVGGPAVAAISDSPARSGVPEATVWQQRLDFNETFAGHTLRIDRDVSVLDNPSAP